VFNVILNVNMPCMATKNESPVKPYAGATARRYFHGVADARFIIRKVFRIVDERAKNRGLDALEHQALIQIYGLRENAVRVGTVAERLDIAAAFASKLVKALNAKGYVESAPSPDDQRVSHLKATAAGAKLLAEIDADVRFHVDFFTRGLTAEQKTAALSIFSFYVGSKASASTIR
jgi:DNA-binding MarR family transcriptional regulator